MTTARAPWLEQYARPRMTDAATDRAQPDERAQVSLPWLTRLRWGAVAGELATVAIVQYGLDIALPLRRVLVFVAVKAATNLVLLRGRRLGRVGSRRLCGAILTLDSLLLTGLLQATGGPSNPFSVLYLVYITLAAVVLGAAWTWGLAALSATCYGLLFLLEPAGGADAMGHAHAGSAFSMHLYAMWVAFSVAAALTAYFVVQLAAAIERRDRELAAVREQATRYERLAALTTLAAGAAHELGTPLGTIAIAATELERAVAGLPPAYAAALGEDTGLIREELARCRAILDRLAADAGGPAGETPTPVAVGTLVADVLGGLGAGARARVETAVPTPPFAITVPRRALTQALSSLVDNALDAMPGGGSVELSVRSGTGGVALVVRDHGPGMAAAVLARAAEPFFTTKPPGRGLGLGLFLVKALAEQLGGRLVLDSVPGAGVTAAIELPASVLTARSAHAAA